jgi:hypothetical protein
MPAQDRLRSNDLAQIEQARHETGHPHHQGSVASAQLNPMWGTAQGNIELMPEEEVLGFKPLP